MAEFFLEEICRATNGKTDYRGTLKFSGVSTDTRTIRPGDLFIALSGERFDGHHYVKQAIEQGAAGAVVSRMVDAPAGACIVETADTLKALQALARLHRQRFSIPVIAITGSNGKTTTKDMLAAVLGQKLSVLKTEANFNNEIGLPLTLLKLTAGHQAAVVEMGMRGLGEIAELAAIALPTVGIVTNVGETHIERLGSLEAIAAAKGELPQALPADGIAVLNYDNDFVKNMETKTAARVVFFGFQQAAAVRAEAVQSGDQVEFTCHFSGGEFSVTLPVPGKHNVYNALAAISAGLALGLTPADISRGLATFSSGAMRLAIETKGSYTVINDAYNASPLSMEAAIHTLAEVAKTRKVAVLGDMLELGEFAAAAHQTVGRRLAESKVDAVVAVGPHSAHIAETAAKAGVSQAWHYETHEAAVAKLSEILLPGDTILVKGSRGMQMEQILTLLKLA